MAEQQPSGAQRQFGQIAPFFAEMTDDVLFGQVWSRRGVVCPGPKPGDRCRHSSPAAIPNSCVSTFRTRSRMA